MIVVALVYYEVLWDDEYAYVERFEREYNDIVVPERAKIHTRNYILKNLIKRGLVINSIKELSVEYEKSEKRSSHTIRVC